MKDVQLFESWYMSLKSSATCRIMLDEKQSIEMRYFYAVPLMRPLLKSGWKLTLD